MSTVKSQFFQMTMAAVVFIFILGALSMTWPVIMALFWGVLLLLESFNADLEIEVLSWVGGGHVSFVVATLLRPRFPVVVS